MSDLVHSVSLTYDNHAGIVAAGGIALDRQLRDGEFTQGNYTYTNLQYRSQKSSLSFFGALRGPNTIRSTLWHERRHDELLGRCNARVR